MTEFNNVSLKHVRLPPNISVLSPSRKKRLPATDSQTVSRLVKQNLTRSEHIPRPDSLAHGIAKAALGLGGRDPVGRARLHLSVAFWQLRSSETAATSAPPPAFVIRSRPRITINLGGGVPWRNVRSTQVLFDLVIKSGGSLIYSRTVSLSEDGAVRELGFKPRTAI